MPVSSRVQFPAISSCLFKKIGVFFYGFSNICQNNRIAPIGQAAQNRWAIILTCHSPGLFFS